MELVLPDRKLEITVSEVLVHAWFVIYFMIILNKAAKPLNPHADCSIAISFYFNRSKNCCHLTIRKGPR